MAGGCLSDEALAAAAAGELDASAHLDACEMCRRALSVIAMASQPDGASGGELAIGEVLDGFTVTRKLGEGGMGQVWAARDRELDREVALKLLHADPHDADDDRGRERLKREAQAMAKLRHPNVVTVYELGSDRGRVFCAMELVDGTTFRRWNTPHRSWREVVGAAIAAGRGLAAAHAVGLVHRDIKPDNVLIANDGRVLVTDFGLAKPIGSSGVGAPLDFAARELATVNDRSPRPSSAAPSDNFELTKPNTVVGTPAYMAPEQLRGERVDAASDQFAFCVMLYEALYDSRPFDDGAEQVDDILAAQERGVAMPAGDVPARVARALAKGLAFEPGERWPSVEALVAELERALVRRRALVIASVGVIAVGSALALWAHGPSQRELAHDAAVHQIDRAWGAVPRTLLATEIAAKRGSSAHREIELANATLDDYRRAWIAMHDEAWTSRHVTHTQDGVLFEKRMACLDTLATKLGTMVSTLSAWGEGPLGNVTDRTSKLDGVAICGDAQRLEAMTPPPTSIGGKAAEASLDQIEGAILAGRRGTTMARAQAQVMLMDALGEPQPYARALFDFATLLADLGDDNGEPMMRQAILAASDAKDHVLVAEAWLGLYLLVATKPERASEIAAIDLATVAAIAQAGNDARNLAFLASTRAAASYTRGDFETARTSLTEARGRFIALRGAGHPDVAQIEIQLAQVTLATGRYDEARRSIQHALSIFEQTMGSTDAVATNASYQLGVIYQAEKNYPAAVTSYQQAIAIATRLLGPTYPRLAMMHLRLMRVRIAQHELADAARELELARPLAMKQPILRTAFGAYESELAIARGDYPAAELRARDALEQTRRAFGGASEQTAFAESQLASVLSHTNPKAALPYYDDAFTISVAAITLRDPHMDADVLTELATTSLAAHDTTIARKWFARLPDAAKLVDGKLAARL